MKVVNGNCFPGYKGKACGHQSCPSFCVGNGTRILIKDLSYGIVYNEYYMIVRILFPPSLEVEGRNSQISHGTRIISGLASVMVARPAFYEIFDVSNG